MSIDGRIVFSYSKTTRKWINICTIFLFQATKEFIEAVNKCRAGRRAGPVSWSTAVKFLAARKFEVQRALALYEQHEATRRREGLAVLHPTQEPLLSELRTGKFTVLVRLRRQLKCMYLFRSSRGIFSKRINILIVLAIKRCDRCSNSYFYSAFTSSTKYYAPNNSASKFV